MMKEYVFDLETDGLLDELTQIHSLVAQDIGTGEMFSYHGEDIIKGVELLSKADTLIGHNIIGFDLLVLERLFKFKHNAKLIDTLVLSQIIYGDLFGYDMAVFRRKLTPQHYGRHSLEAWGHRLSNKKIMFGETTDWKTWTKEMQVYCEQDVRVNVDIYRHLMKQHITTATLELEMKFAQLMVEQQHNGFKFDVGAAMLFEKELRSEIDTLEEELQEIVPPTLIELKTKTKVIPFNPGSQMQVAAFFEAKYEWHPTEVTKTGKAKITDTILSELDYPEAEKIARFYKLRKVLGMLADGPTAWLKLQKEGRIHGRVKTNGAVSGRCTHSTPNVSQVPSVKTDLGVRCRSLFIAGEGNVIVGCDASGIEGRCLSHFLYRHDKGEFRDELLDGDIHSKNAEAFGCDRNTAKTAFYALLYGCGGKKLATTLGREEYEGTEIIASYYSTWPQIKALTDEVQATAKTRRYLRGIDGRHLSFRKIYSTLNLVLQSGGALIMKKAAVILDEKLTATFINGVDYKMVANIHDEFQIEVKEEHAKAVGELARESIIEAGVFFKFHCPLDAEYKIGANWAQTH